MSDDARVTVSVEGDDDIVRAAEQARGAWTRAGGEIGRAVGSLGSTIATGMKQAASDILRVSTAMGSLNFASAIQSATKLNDSIARMGIASGQSFEQMQKRIEGVARASNSSDSQTIAWRKAVGGLTHDFAAAEKSQKAFRDMGLLTGKTLEEMAPIAESLANQFGVKGSGSEMFLGKMTAQAKALGIEIGVAVDKLGKLNVAGVSTKDAGKLTAFNLALTKGLTPQEGQQVSSSVYSSILGQQQLISRTLGRNILDKQGRVEDLPGTVRAIRENFQRRFGSDAQRRLTNSGFGPMAAAAIMNMDFAQVDRVAGLSPHLDARRAGRAYDASQAGDRNKVEHDIERAHRKVGGQLAPYQTMLGKLQAEHPIAMQAGEFLLGSLGQGLAAKWMMGGGGKAAGSVAGTAAKGVGSRALVGAGLRGIAGPAGLAALVYENFNNLGTHADNALGLSDWFSGKNEGHFITPDDKDPSYRLRAQHDSLRNMVSTGQMTPDQASRTMAGVARSFEGSKDISANSQALVEALRGIRLNVVIENLSSTTDIQVRDAGTEGAQ